MYSLKFCMDDTMVDGGRDTMGLIRIAETFYSSDRCQFDKISPLLHNLVMIKDASRTTTNKVRGPHQKVLFRDTSL